MARWSSDHLRLSPVPIGELNAQITASATFELRCRFSSAGSIEGAAALLAPRRDRLAEYWTRNCATRVRRAQQNGTRVRQCALHEEDEFSASHLGLEPNSTLCASHDQRDTHRKLGQRRPRGLEGTLSSEPLRPPERQDPVGLRRTRAFEILVHAMKKRHRLTVADTWSCCSILELRAHGPKLHWRMKCWCRWNRRRCRPSRTILKFSS